MDDRAKAIEFLKDCHFMTVAVISEGRAWAVPVHIQQIDGWNFEWDSHPEAFQLYIDGTFIVEAVSVEQIEDVLASMFSVDTKEVDGF